MTTPERPVLVVIPTFRRLALLPDLIAVVRAQIEEVCPAARVVVVDNDPEESARSTAGEVGVEYVAEHRPGIAAARQRALDIAEPGELVVMIDDDLVPQKSWLRDLLATWQRTGAAVVMGYVRYVWPEGTDPLIAAGGFMRRNEHPDGAALTDLATGSVLVDADQICALGVSFDQGLGLSGGEDTRFGKSVVDQGGSVVASTSVALDQIPRDRATWGFVRRRAIGHGQTAVLIALDGKSGLDAVLGRAHCFLGGSARWIVFTGWRLAGRASRNTSLEAVGLRRSWFAVGRMQAAVGHRHAEYAR